jgi:cell wall assembly regulator SMI1
LLDALEYRERGNVARIIRFERDNDRNWVHGAFMTPAQAENFEQVVKFIRDLLDNARAVGQHRGESVLLQLASGDLSVNEFNDRTIHNKNQ